MEDGILTARPYQERPPRYEYRLTQKGIDLWPVLMTLMASGATGTRPSTARRG